MKGGMKRPLCLQCGDERDALGNRRRASAGRWHPFCTQRCAARWALSCAEEYCGMVWDVEEDAWVLLQPDRDDFISVR
jgi:hypothetical protein